MFLLLTLNIYFTLFSSVSILNFEQVKVGWVSFMTWWNSCGIYIMQISENIFNKCSEDFGHNSPRKIVFFIRYFCPMFLSRKITNDIISLIKLSSITIYTNDFYSTTKLMYKKASFKLDFNVSMWLIYCGLIKTYEKNKVCDCFYHQNVSDVKVTFCYKYLEHFPWLTTEYADKIFIISTFSKCHETTIFCERKS